MDAAERIAAVQRAQKGDRQAFGKLVDHYWGRVYRWLSGMVQPAQTAEDLAQEVFLKCWRALPGFQTGADLKPWLFRIARNCLIDHLRASRPEEPVLLAEGAPAREPGPLEQCEFREGEALLHRACARLPVIFRSAYLLWAQEGMSFAEVAAALDITEETARWRVFKARRLLVQDLGSYLDRKKP